MLSPCSPEVQVRNRAPNRSPPGLGKLVCLGAHVHSQWSAVQCDAQADDVTRGESLPERPPDYPWKFGSQPLSDSTKVAQRA